MSRSRWRVRSRRRIKQELSIATLSRRTSCFGRMATRKCSILGSQSLPSRSCQHRCRKTKRCCWLKPIWGRSWELFATCHLSRRAASRLIKGPTSGVSGWCRNASDAGGALQAGPQKVMSAILDKEPPPLTRYLAHPSAELQQIISKTLRKDREERYHSAHEILHALKELRRRLEFKLQRAAAP